MSVGPVASGAPQIGGGAGRTADMQDVKLRKTAQQLEGVFVQQMYKAMRDTVPSDGMFSGGSGEQMFTGLLDERIAADTPAKWSHGLSEAIYKHLRQALPGAAHAPAGLQANVHAAAATTSGASDTAISAASMAVGSATRSTPE